MESDNGANASAMIFSIAETAKTNNLNTYDYFELLLSEIPKHQDDKNLDFINKLLPWSKSVQEKCPSRYKNLNSLIKVQIYEIASKMTGFYFVLMDDDLHNFLIAYMMLYKDYFPSKQIVIHIIQHSYLIA